MIIEFFKSLFLFFVRLFRSCSNCEHFTSSFDVIPDCRCLIHREKFGGYKMINPDDYCKNWCKENAKKVKG